MPNLMACPALLSYIHECLSLGLQSRPPDPVTDTLGTLLLLCETTSFTAQLYSPMVRTPPNLLKVPLSRFVSVLSDLCVVTKLLCTAATIGFTNKYFKGFCLKTSFISEQLYQHCEGRVTPQMNV